MTWGRLQLLVKGLLSGDYFLPEDEEINVTLLQMAMEEVCNVSSPLKLYINVTDAEASTREFIRQFELEVGVDPETNLPQRVRGYIMRPLLPSTSNDVLDIDEGLTYAVARLMVSYVAAIENKKHHKNEAYNIMDFYKVNVVSQYDKWNRD